MSGREPMGFNSSKMAQVREDDFSDTSSGDFAPKNVRDDDQKRRRKQMIGHATKLPRPLPSAKRHQGLDENDEIMTDSEDSGDRSSGDRYDDDIGSDGRHSSEDDIDDGIEDGLEEAIRSPVHEKERGNPSYRVSKHSGRGNRSKVRAEAERLLDAVGMGSDDGEDEGDGDLDAAERRRHDQRANRSSVKQRTRQAAATLSQSPARHPSPTGDGESDSPDQHSLSRRPKARPESILLANLRTSVEETSGLLFEWMEDQERRMDALERRPVTASAATTAIERTTGRPAKSTRAAVALSKTQNAAARRRDTSPFTAPRTARPGVAPSRPMPNPTAHDAATTQPASSKDKPITSQHRPSKPNPSQHPPPKPNPSQNLPPKGDAPESSGNEVDVDQHAGGKIEGKEFFDENGYKAMELCYDQCGRTRGNDSTVSKCDYRDIDKDPPGCGNWKHKSCASDRPWMCRECRPEFFKRSGKEFQGAMSPTVRNRLEAEAKERKAKGEPERKSARNLTRVSKTPAATPVEKQGRRQAKDKKKVQAVKSEPTSQNEPEKTKRKFDGEEDEELVDARKARRKQDPKSHK